MKSRKIQRLEFVSDKIEGGDSKREVIYIRFDHPTKKNELVRDSPWEDGASWEPMGSSPERGERGKGKRERGRS
jgi:hypothetical protein